MSIARRAMVSDLQAHHLRLGMTQREVRALLGYPYTSHAGWWEWITGTSTWDCWTFLVRFENGRLVETAEGQT